MNLPPATIMNVTQADQVTLSLTITAENDAFNGHFPGEPILPGVVQLDWALQAARTHLGCTEVAARDFRIKFHNIIRPNMPVILYLHLDRARGRLDFTYKSDNATMSAGQMRFGATS